MLAHLVLGPESSNPMKAAKELIAAGCQLHTNTQETPTTSPVVIVRPVPDGSTIPILHGIVEALLRAGYDVRVTVTERDWTLMAEIFRIANNQLSLEQAEAVLRDAYERIFIVIRDFRLRFTIVHTGETAVEVKPVAPLITKPRKLLLYSHMSPGDIMMLTATVRDLHRAHPSKFITDVYTSCGDIWQNNPHITKLKWRGEKRGDSWVPVAEEPDLEIIKCHYNGSFPADVNKSSVNAYHFIHGFTQFLESYLNVRIPVTEFKGDIFISEVEKRWLNQVEETGYKGPFWIMMAGGKRDFTTKWAPPEHYQAVVDHFKDRILFVQCGEKHHWHPPLRNVLNLVGQTDTRKFIRLMYHASGVVCPITFAMHLAAAVETKLGRPVHRPCVVIAGGRESPGWEAYPWHRFLHTMGSLPCCDVGACWKSRCHKIGDGDEKDKPENLCKRPIRMGEYDFAECMTMIKPDDIIRAIESYLYLEKGKK